MKLTTNEIPAEFFFDLDELYHNCCEYAITHLCSFEAAQIVVLGMVLFE